MLNSIFKENVIPSIMLIMIIISCILQIIVIVMLLFNKSVDGPSLREEEVQSVLNIYKTWQTPVINKNDCNAYDPSFYDSLFKAK